MTQYTKEELIKAFEQNLVFSLDLESLIKNRLDQRKELPRCDYDSKFNLLDTIIDSAGVEYIKLGDDYACVIYFFDHKEKSKRKPIFLLKQDAKDSSFYVFVLHLSNDIEEITSQEMAVFLFKNMTAFFLFDKALFIVSAPNWGNFNTKGIYRMSPIFPISHILNNSYYEKLIESKYEYLDPGTISIKLSYCSQSYAAQSWTRSTTVEGVFLCKAYAFDSLKIETEFIRDLR